MMRRESRLAVRTRGGRVVPGRPLRACSVVVLVLAVATQSYGRTVIHVDDDAPPGGDGQSWQTAYRSLQDALDRAAACAGVAREIRVAAGVYRPSATTDPTDPRTATFRLVDGVAIQGGYAGLAAPKRPNWRNPAMHVSTLSGDIHRPHDHADNAYHVITAIGVGPKTRVSGFTITRGRADGADFPYGHGAGMWIQNASPKIEKCLFVANEAAGKYAAGGALACTGSSSPSFVSCVFRANRADHWGGALYCWGKGTAVSFSDSTFEGNTGDKGGAIACYSDASLTLRSCAIVGNSGRYGGGMRICHRCQATVQNVVVVGNTARSDGGGISIWADNTGTITNSVIVGNSSPTGGGIFCSLRTQLTLSNCTLQWNKGTSGDGVFIHENAHLQIANCIFSQNGNFAVYSPDAQRQLQVTHSLFGGHNDGVFHAGPQETYPTAAAADEALPAWQSNKDGDPGFVVLPSGTWTLQPVYDPASNRTWLADANGAFDPDALVGMVVRPNANHDGVSLVAANTETAIQAIGDLTHHTAAGNQYALLDYHLAGTSVCIDAGDPDIDYSGQTDIDNANRLVNRRADMGADEFASPRVLAPRRHRARDDDARKRLHGQGGFGTQPEARPAEDKGEIGRTDSVAPAAIKRLRAVIRRKAAEIAELKRRVSAIEAGSTGPMRGQQETDR